MASNKRRKNGKGDPKRGGPHFSDRQRDIESLDMRKGSRVPPDGRGTSDCHSGTPNDWRWYAMNSQLVKDYASYPFGTPLGNKLQTGIAAPDKQAIPGIWRFNFYPAIGFADNENSPINVAMRRLYSYVRHANSGASNYDAPDLMLYMVCVDSAIMYHSWLKRVYGFMMNSSPYTRYLPKAIIEAMGINYDDISLNINDFRGYINQYAVKLSQLWIPNSMSYMARHSWMCEAVYTDSTSAKAQLYFYNPAGFYTFTLDDQGVGSAVMTKSPALDGLMTFNSLVDFGNSLLNPMIANEDFGIMSGDILKAFGQSGIYQAQGITEEYRVLPVYSAEVLSQMENATQFAGVLTSSLNVTQMTAVGTGYLVSRPQAGVGAVAGVTGTTLAPEFITGTVNKASEYYMGRKILNFHNMDVTPEQIMVATRLTNIIEGGPEQVGTIATLYGQYANGYTNVTTCSSEILGLSYVYYFGTSAAGDWTLLRYDVNDVMNMPIYVGAQYTDNIQKWLDARSAVSQFDWHPGIWPVTADYGSNQFLWVDPSLPMQDLDFYTFLDAVNLKNMALTALLSEFSIPNI